MAATTPPLWQRLPLFGNFGLPIALKEVRSLMRRNRFFWVQFVYLLILGFGVVTIIWSQYSSQKTPEIISQTLFNGFFILQNFLVLLVFPAFAAISISSERVERSFDLLITTDLRPVEIVWGKFIGVFGNCCYFLLATLPLLGTSMLFGGVRPWLVLESYTVLLVEAALITAFGLLVSAGSKGNLRAILSTYALVAIVGLVTLFVFIRFEPTSGLYTLSGVLDRMGSWPGVQTALWGGIAYATTVSFLFCFSGAVLLLTNRESNRETPLRILTLASLVLGFLLLAYVFQLREASGVQWVAREKYRVFWRTITLVFFLLPLPILGFAGTRVATPLRTARSARDHRARAVLSWIFLPGAARGFAFSVLLLGLTLIGLEALGGAFFDLPTEPLRHRLPPEVTAREAFRSTFWLLSSGLLAYAALAFLLSSVDVRGYLNHAIVIGCAILANLYPVVHLDPEDPTGTSTAPWYAFFPLSILVSILRFWDDSMGVTASSTGSAVFLHVGLAAAFVLLAAFFIRREQLPVFGFRRPELSER